jgi:hypothetical protein
MLLLNGEGDNRAALGKFFLLPSRPKTLFGVNVYTQSLEEMYIQLGLH